MTGKNETQGPLTSGTYQSPDHCAWTDPLCPDPMEKGSMFCGMHKVAACQRVLRTVISRYFDMLHGKVDDTTAEGSAEQDLRQERVDAAMQLIDLVSGHMLPYSLANLVSTIELPEGPR
jgi:hypothetical protein